MKAGPIEGSIVPGAISNQQAAEDKKLFEDDVGDDDEDSPTKSRADTEEATGFVPYKIDKKELKEALSNAADTLDEDIKDVNIVMELFLDSRFNDCEAVLKDKYCKSLYHTMAAGIILAFKAIMTFDKYDLDAANDALKNAVEVASSLRKETSIVSSFAGYLMGSTKKEGDHLKSMTRLQRHAEVVFAESYLIKAMLCLMTDTNLIAFVREGLNMRQSFIIAKQCFKFLRNSWDEGGPDGLAKNQVDSDFIAATQLGVGATNLILSVLPSRVLRVFEMIGFSGKREFGMKSLELAANWPKRLYENTMPSKKSKKKEKVAIDFHLPGQEVRATSARGYMSDLILQVYHVALASMIQLPGCNLANADLMLNRVLSTHKDSFMHLLLQARLRKAQGRAEESITLLDRVINGRIEWKGLVHLCHWEKGLGHAALRQWSEAANSFDILMKESKWSPAIYKYSRAVFLYMADKESHKTEIRELMLEVPKLCKRVAGKSIPFEKYVARKARKYILQNERLLLPGYELIFMYDTFDHIPKAGLEETMKDIDVAIADLDEQAEKFKRENPGDDDAIPYPNYYDDVCLTRFLKGLVSRELVFPTSSTLITEAEFAALVRKPEQKEALQYAIRQMEFLILQADTIALDHWILPFSRYETGQLYSRMGDYTKARREYNAALNGGYADDEPGHAKRKTSMENSLHLRVHNALIRLDVIEGFVRGDHSRSPSALPTDPEDSD